MSDIVERLKSPAVLIDNGGMVSLVAYEAADEITRLRAELAAAIAERDAVIERAEKYQRTAAELYKSYGRVYTPVFEVIDWIPLDGPTADEPSADTGRRRRRRG